MKIGKWITLYACMIPLHFLKNQLFQKFENKNIQFWIFSEINSVLTVLTYSDTQNFICKQNYFTGVPGGTNN